MTLLLYVLYPGSPMLLSYDPLSTAAAVHILLLLFPLLVRCICRTPAQ